VTLSRRSGSVSRWAVGKSRWRSSMRLCSRWCRLAGSRLLRCVTGCRSAGRAITSIWPVSAVRGWRGCSRGRVHPVRPAQRSAAPQRPLGAAAAGGARCRLVAGDRCHHGDRLRFPPGERSPEQRPAPGRKLPDGYRPGDLGHRSVRPGLGDPNLRVIDGSLHVTNGGGESGTDDLRQCVPDHAYLGGSGRNYL
jgi:hypothetical protein